MTQSTRTFSVFVRFNFRGRSAKIFVTGSFVGVYTFEKKVAFEILRYYYYSQVSTR